MRVIVLAERRYRKQAQPAGVAAELARRGCEVIQVDPASTAVEVTCSGWLGSADICVARGRSQAVLSLLAAAEAAGAPAVNSSRSTAAVRDKAGMAAVLAGAGIPTPSTYIGSAASLASEIPAARYPLIVKPILGDNCQGLRRIDAVAELSDDSGGRDEAVLAQPYVPGPGYDLKLYGIGDHVWAVRKRSPFAATVEAYAGSRAESGPRSEYKSTSNGAQAEQAAESAPLTPRLRELALACRSLFGLELYGVDCLETDAGPLVIEVNEFPNYTAVPGADQRLADYVIAKAAGVRSR